VDSDVCIVAVEDEVEAGFADLQVAEGDAVEAFRQLRPVQADPQVGRVDLQAQTGLI
jgi:hypothetical protein